MPQFSLIRLYALRAGYLLVAGGLALTIWPLLLSPPDDWPLMNSVVAAMLGALALLAALGLRYPLQMLPVLMFELAWKTIWLVAVALPLWRAGAIDPRTAETVRDCLLGAILIPVIPWGYVLDRYVRQPGERWRTAAAPAPAPEPGR